MANIPFPARTGDTDLPEVFQMLSTGDMPWVHPPRFGWEITIDHENLHGDHTTLSGSFVFGGTEANGNYVTNFLDEDGNVIDTVTTPRVGGNPATSADLAAEHAANITTAIAGDLAGVIASASDSDETVSWVAEPGVFVRLTHTAPAGATLDTDTYSAEIDLNTMAGTGNGFPANVIRSWCMVNVIEAFGTGSTLQVGESGALGALIGNSSAVDLTVTGRSGSTPTDASQYQPRPELAFAPLATIALGDTSVLTEGEVLIEILYQPNLANRA